MDDVIIDPDVMTKDAENVWQNASTKMQEIKSSAPKIATPAFSFIFDCVALDASYRKGVAALARYLEAGSTEFLRFEKRLLEAVIIYGKSHDMSTAEIAALQEMIDL